MEEIIIDGIDVSGCEFYQIEANDLYPKAQYCGSMRNTFCENEPNCYYKQLKRKEKEVQTLRSALQEIKEIAKPFTFMYCSERNLANPIIKKISEVEE